LHGDHQVAFEFGRSIANQPPDVFALGDAIEQSLGRTVRLELAGLTRARLSGVEAWTWIKQGLFVNEIERVSLSALKALVIFEYD
jgi:hypothetical protein